METGAWCNGNITDSKPADEGSTPSAPAKTCGGCGRRTKCVNLKSMCKEMRDYIHQDWLPANGGFGKNKLIKYGDMDWLSDEDVLFKI